MHNFWLLVALSCLLTHEMDAVRQREWRMLPLLRRIRDDTRAYVLFTLLHLPLYVALLGGLLGGGASIPLRIGFNLFCGIHVVLHLLLRRHPEYRFNNWFSWAMIMGAGVAAAVDLVVGVRIS